MLRLAIFVTWLAIIFPHYCVDGYVGCVTQLIARCGAQIDGVAFYYDSDCLGGSMVSYVEDMDTQTSTNSRAAVVYDSTNQFVKYGGSGGSSYTFSIDSTSKYIVEVQWCTGGSYFGLGMFFKLNDGYSPLLPLLFSLSLSNGQVHHHRM